MYGPLGVGHSVPIMGSLHDRNQQNQTSDQSRKGQEAPLELTAAGVQNPDSKVCDSLAVDCPGSDQWHASACAGG